MKRAKSRARSHRPRRKSGGASAKPGGIQNVKPGEIIGELVAGEPPASEDGYFYACPDCGQAVDERDLAQVIHHEEPGHKPMKLPRRILRPRRQPSVC
jgi:hypothetical protein